MSDTTQSTPSDETGKVNGLGQPVVMTPELVQQVVDKVYALWRRDLQVEKERARETRPSRQWRF
jgi:coproporphyrinogen III oxidase-like Fe-S oxidoreductase